MPNQLLLFLDMIKFHHTLFALPFAVVGAVYAAEGVPDLRTSLLILAAMVGARTCAMGFNRLADHELDARNPRTADRALPRGLLSRGAVWAWTLGSAAVLFAAAAALNRLCLLLAPVALLIVLGYSYTKRFTALCHFVLGLGLACAPVGAWLAVRPIPGESIDLPAAVPFFPVLLGLAVLLWTAGFDILYAAMDVDFDRANGVHSIPAAVGVPAALRISAGLHAATVAALAAAGRFAGLGAAWWTGVGAIALLLAYEHAIVRPDDLRRVNRAFFAVNAVVSITVMIASLGDLYLRHGGIIR